MNKSVKIKGKSYCNTDGITYRTYRRGLLYIIQNIKVRCAVRSWRFWELKHILKAFCTVVATELAKGNEVQMMGFGTFRKEIGERGGVSISFTAGNALRKMVETGWEGRQDNWPNFRIKPKKKSKVNDRP